MAVTSVSAGAVVSVLEELVSTVKFVTGSGMLIFPAESVTVIVQSG